MQENLVGQFQLKVSLSQGLGNSLMMAWLGLEDLLPRWFAHINHKMVLIVGRKLQLFSTKWRTL